MRPVLILYIIILTSVSHELFAGKTSLSGKITDKENGEGIPGANVYIPDLKIGTVSKADGTYRIDNLPQTSILVQVSFTGYKTLLERVDLASVSTKDFVLEQSVTEINTVVVTGTSASGEKNKTPTPISVVTQTQLLQTPSSNIIDAMATQPGISQVTTGSGISKPVIRGLGYNRVVVVNDGIRQEGQQWGDEHGVEIDEFGVNHVEILKGPASLAYGSDAMAGVINMLSAPTLPEGEVKGNLLGNYQTNNGQIGYSGNLAGNLKGFIWDLRYSGKRAHAYQNKYDGYVYGSGFNESTLGGIIGLNKSWGYSHLHFSTYHFVPGIVEGERDSATGKFTRPFALNDSAAANGIAFVGELMSYAPAIPRQDIRHYKAVLNNNFIVRHGNLKSTFGFQQNQRKEFGDVLKPDQYGLYFLMNTINYDVRYIFPEKDQLHVSAGINGMYQRSENMGTEFLVPEYTLFDIGVFAIVKKSFKKLDLSGGLRYDHRTDMGKDLYLDTLGSVVSIPDPFSKHRFTAFDSRFSSVSGSLGFSYRFSDKVFTKLNLSRGFRAPNIAELGANGEHEGTGRYEIGDPAMKAEQSLQLDYAFGINTEHVSAEVDLFTNMISNFIYTAKLNSVSGGDSVVDLSNPIPTFKYTQGNATLSGGEVMIDLHPHPLDWLHFENSFSYVQGSRKNAPDSAKYLPLMPPAKFSSDLRADFKKAGKLFKDLYIKLGIENYFGQDKFYAAFGTETKTPGYTLLNLGAGSDIASKGKTICSLYFGVNNLTDAAYQSHLSRLKYADINYATGRRGVCNMGRNVSVKLIIPIGIRKAKE